jgi:signal transduction histidine kinase
VLSPLLLAWPLALALAGLAAAVAPEHGTTMHLIGRPWLGGLQMAATAALLVLAACARSRRQALAWTAVALSWPLPELAGWSDLPLTERTIADAFSRGIVVLLMLAALPPTRQEEDGAARLAVAVAVAAGGIAFGVRVLLVDPFLDASCWRTCDHNPLLVADVGRAALMVDRGASVLLAVAAAVALWTATRPSRRTSLVSGLSIAATWLLLLAAAAAPVLPWSPGAGADTTPTLVAFTAAQCAALVLSGTTASDRTQEWLLRARLTCLAAQVQAGPAPGSLVDVLRTAVRDPSLEVRYWAPTRSTWVDAQGQPRQLTDPAEPGCTTHVTRGGSPVATIRHGAAVRSDRIERALGPALRLALANEQLRAAALAELNELSTSQVRMLERSALERRRLERNLHDGAQQRAVSLALLVRMLAGQLGDTGRQDLVERAQALTRLVVEELRRVARGIHPAALSDAGLAGAVQNLAEASTAVAVEVVDMPVARLPGPVESTVYLFVAAALTSAEQRGATVARIGAAYDDRLVRLTVADDGHPAPLDLGPLDDQVRALDGHVRSSSSGGGLTVVLEVPCGS